jgi:hypothetical protein
LDVMQTTAAASLRYARSVGFERVDQVAREMAARKPPSRRSRPARWAILVMLGIAGAVGAMYFVVGGSGKPPAMPRKPPQVTPAAAVTAPAVQLAPSSAHDWRAARAAQIAVVLDDLDATLQSMRLTWPVAMGSVAWIAPSWLTPERLAQDLAALDSQLSGADDPLSARTREWIAVARVDGARLFELQAAWSKPGASADAIGAELRPLFDRLAAAGRSVHAAVAADVRAPDDGTMASLAARCRVAPLLARLPDAPPDELRARSADCLDATRSFLAFNPGAELDHADIYRISLATSLAVNLLHEHDRRRRDAAARGVFISAAGNLAQESALLAISRRRDDPSLRQAEAEAVPEAAPASGP